MADSKRSIFYALGANLSIAAAKATGAAFTGSSSMLAEAIHSFADSANQALLLLGQREGKQRPDAGHPLGYGKAIYFWSFIVALMLFSMGGLFSIYEGIHKLGADEPVENPGVAIAILVFALVAEGVSLRNCLVEVNKERGERSLWRWFRTSRTSELLVVFAEDVAALAGLGFALAFIGLALLTGNPVWDAAGSICIGALLVLVAILVAIEVKSLLLGRSVEADVLAKMRTQLDSEADIDEVLDVLTQQLGTDVMVAVKARMREAASAHALVVQINDVEKRFRGAFPQVKWLFFEPDLVP